MFFPWRIWIAFFLKHHTVLSLKFMGRILAKNSWDVYESKWHHLRPFGPEFFYIERVAPLMATIKSA